MDVKETPLPLKKITSFYFAKIFWSTTFKVEGLLLSRLQHDTERNWEIQLTNCRDEAIHNAETFIEDNVLPSHLKIILTDGVFLLHEAYHQLLLWKINYDQGNKIDIMEVGEFYAPNFFSANGKFHDRLWAKHLMQNEKYTTALRFNLASVYHFISDFRKLWDNLFQLEDIPAEEGFNVFGVCHDFRLFKSIFEQRKMQFEQNEREEEINPEREEELRLERGDMDLNPAFFFRLALKGYEYAVYFWWNNMSISKKLALMMDYRYFEMINGGIDFPRCNISYFLYCQLSEDRKQDLYQWSLLHDTSKMWLTFLFTSSGSNFFSEIVAIICKLPISIISNLLQLLSRRIRQLRLPLDADLFETLWNKVSLRKSNLEILKNGKYIIENLLKAKSFHNIGCIIKSFSLAEKYKCLLSGLYGTGINALNVLCKEGEFDLLQDYLSFFINDINSRSEVYNLRRKDNELLKKFSDSVEFQTWYISKLSKTEQTEVKYRIEALKTCSFMNSSYYERVDSSSRISLFKGHFVVKKKSEIISLRQKRSIEKEMIPAKIKKI